jgi:hypothetical protein|tara:strand:+ start:497 stop:691 length:195 start_codon:yes stop_codon:yes gene_type:complete
MIRVVIVFFVFYFWLSALVYADTHQLTPWTPCEPEHEMVMDSSERNPGCDKDYFKENLEQGQEI